MNSLPAGQFPKSLASIGITLPTEEISARYIGISAATMFRDIEARTGRSLPPGFPEKVQEHVLDVFRRNLRAMPGIDTVFEELSCQICVASSSTPERIRLALTVTGLLHYFRNNQFSATQVRHGKPAPDLFLFAAQQMSVEPEESLVVEDSPAGVQAARAAGMAAVGFVGGSHSYPAHADRLLNAGANVVAARALDLPASICEAWWASEQLRSAERS